jgi:hypothetical protein
LKGNPKSEIRNPKSSRRRRSSRRGVLLLVVLSMLVLFMLIGTTFLMTSDSERKGAKQAGRGGRLGNTPTELLDRALMQLLRDTENAASVMQGSGLLRDLYGTDGFQGIIYSPPANTAFNPNDTNFADEVTRFSAGTVDNTSTPVREELGPTQGQLIDIYMRALAHGLDDPFTQTVNEQTQLVLPDLRHVVQINRGARGEPQLHTLSLTKGYYNGCLLTITSGPATGQTARIVDYDYVADIGPNTPTDTPPKFTRLFRFRVMSFSRTDGLPLQVSGDPRRTPEITDLAGATFIVNGRPFNGTGVGLNPLAAAGQPRLNAVQAFTLNGETYGSEIALLPNARYWGPESLPTVAAYLPAPGATAPPNPFLIGTTNSAGVFYPLNNLGPANPFFNYPRYLGAGDADEPYDAADFQNMFLALLTVTPRAQARIVLTNGTFDLDHPQVFDASGRYVGGGNFMRLDLENVPLPSFHRPDLVNFWYHRLLTLLSENMDPNEAMRAIIQPYDANGDPNPNAGSLTPEQAALIAGIKRKIMMRPIREDHPRFDGGNPRSAAPNVTNVNNLATNNGLATFPFWEITGPWDVDNDNDGVPDSVWIDLGDPIQEFEDGTRYKPLYAFLVIDLDSRLNVNAHGLVEHIYPPRFRRPRTDNNGDGLINELDKLETPLESQGDGADNDGDGLDDEQGEAGDQLNALAGIFDADMLPTGIGYGTAEISLRPLFPRPWINASGNPQLLANCSEVGGAPIIDSLATLFWGRERLDGTTVSGRLGYSAPLDPTIRIDLASPGTNYRYVAPAGTPTGEQAIPDLAARLKFFDYPWAITQLSVFGAPPDLFGRYAVGLDYVGQPTYEVLRDRNAWDDNLVRPLLTDTPYELNINSAQRRDTWAASFPDAATAFNASLVQNDDAAFSTADLERILRGADADSGLLPSRLWEAVDVFDPLRMAIYNPFYTASFANDILDPVNRSIPALNNPNQQPSAELMTGAQILASINRKLVTTDSSDLPVPGGNFLSRLLNGADGQPGRANVDDDEDNGPDDPGEQGWGGSDDFHAVMNNVPILPVTAPPDSSLQPTPPLDTPQNANIVDLLRYRVQFERLRRALPIYNEADLSQVVQQLLSPEVIAGLRMDLNRPFGDGRDNGDGVDNDNDGSIDETGEDLNADGVADTLAEAGDTLMNGIVDDPLEAGDPFADSNAIPNGRFDAGEQFYDMDGNGVYTPPLDRLWSGLTAEEIFFDYNHGSALLNGRLSDGRPYDGNADGVYDPAEPSDGRIRANGLLQRQIFARHLYCLAMLLSDENYVATENVLNNEEGNVNFVHFYNDLWHQQALQLAGGNPLTSANITAAAAAVKPLWARKLTARRVAQWAINVVDFRDPDSIMTPFEYDEYPFDGWGVYVPDPADDNPDRTQRAKIFIPLDGDIASDENLGGELPYPKKYKPNEPAGPQNRDDEALVEDATRAVVWGAERPELLITETLAWHDRRATDEGDEGRGGAGQPPQNVPGGAQTNVSILNQNAQTPDHDLDQRLKPRGSLFVELYNPWSRDGQRPAGLYGRTLITPGRQAQLSEPGVLLNQMSLLPARVTDPRTNQQVVRYSPVWRMSVVRDPINGRMATELIEDPADFQKVYIKQLLRTDPDGFGFNSDQDSERLIYFTTGNDPNRTNDHDLQNEYDQATPPQPKVVNPNLNIWVPPVVARFEPVAGRPAVIPMTKRYFIGQVERQLGTGPNSKDIPIAPILPGRYAVIGSSGIQLTLAGNSVRDTQQPGDPQRFVTPVSRLRGGSQSEQEDREHIRSFLAQTRRFELWPSVNPNVQQVLTAQNGGQEIVDRGGGNYVNVTDSDFDGTPDASSNLVDPAVAIPVEDLNISEPLEGYPSFHYQIVASDPTQNPNAGNTPVNAQQPQLNQYGEWAYQTPYDRPFDMDIELVRNGTTQNYRSVHLQRLANPTLPWNPPPVDENGNENKLHQINLPINPYLTIDSQSVDLTAFNGASDFERTELPVDQNMDQRDLLQENYFAPLSPSEFRTAPDHVVQGLIDELTEKGIFRTNRSSEWITPKDFLKRFDDDQIARYLTQLEQRKGGNDTIRRTLLDPARIGVYRFHQLRRVLPDDQAAMSGRNTNYQETNFKQRLHLKSQERGNHHLEYDFGPNDEGWDVDSAWEPRLLWKQERPNVTLIFRTATGSATLSDLKNVWSRRVLTGVMGPIDYNTTPPRDPVVSLTQDEKDRAAWLKAQRQPALNFTEQHVMDYVVEQTLGFVNEAYAPNLDRMDGTDTAAFMKSIQIGAPEVVVNNGVPAAPAAPEADELRRWNVLPRQKIGMSTGEELNRRQKLLRSTYPWLAWNNRPFASSEELLQVPGTSGSLMLRYFSVVNDNTRNPYDGTIRDDGTGTTSTDRYARQQGVFGHLLNFFNTAELAAGTYKDAAGAPVPFSGAPHFYRVMEYVDVPSRFVGTETRLTAEIFNDVLGDDPSDGVDPIGTDLTGFDDPRYNLQPPFNTISRRSDPGRVNLNTVMGRRERVGGTMRIWSDVYDGIMHRDKGSNFITTDASGDQHLLQLGHLGPAWRDIVLSRRGYAHINADLTSVDKVPDVAPDAFQFGLDKDFPSFFSNPFRSPDAGDLVPLPQMVRYGVDAGWLRRHHFNRGGRQTWGSNNVDDNGDLTIDDSREAGYGGDDLVFDSGTGALLPVNSTGPINPAQSGIPLFSETFNAPFIAGERNSYMMYQPMSRLGNLVTNRSGVFAVWITVGYFEVEKAPNWAANENNVQQRMGGDGSANSPATIAAQALYSRVYPDGYMLGREVGSDTGDVKRHRGFYIIDRTEEVGFKPGEDLNVEKTIRLRRRID